MFGENVNARSEESHERPAIRMLLLEESHEDAERILAELHAALPDITAIRVQTQSEFQEQLVSSGADLILADYSLANFDGPSALRMVRALAPDTPLIFVSEAIGQEKAVEAFRQGASDYVLKDRLTALAPAVTRAIERRRQHARRRADHVTLHVGERLREAQSLAHLGSWDYDITTGVALCSEEIYAILGVDPGGELSFETSMNIAHPDDRPNLAAALTSQFHTGKPDTLQVQYRIDRHGVEHVVECRSRVFLDDNDVPVRAAGTLQDITDQAMALQSIEHLRKRSDLILECAAEGIVGVDRTGRPTFCNPAACSLFGRSESELLACTDSHAALHHSRADGTPFPREECAVYLTLQDGRKRTVPSDLFFRKDGQPFAVEFECAAVIEAGEIVGGVVTFRDVTESHRLNRQLDLAKRIGSLGRVAATIAHEFNNVLMGVEPFAEIIRRGAHRDAKIVKAADQISSSVRRGRRVTDAILRFTRPAEPVFRDVDLCTWLMQLEPELRVLAGPAVRITLSMPRGPLFAACDAAQLQQVMTNLVLNARDAMRDGGTVSILLRTAADAMGAELIVRDTGSGIPHHELENVFEPLFTTKRAGTGLGLAVARQIVTLHEGTIDVSNVEGGGAQFRILLPFLDALVAPDPSGDAQASTGKQRTLLLVEDEEVIAFGLSALLSEEGFSVHWVSTGGEVLDAVEKFAPDVVILDLTLPDLSGTVVFDMIRERWPSIPVVFSTGHGGESDLAEQLSQGRAMLLQKPYAIAALIAAVDQVMNS